MGKINVTQDGQTVVAGDNDKINIDIPGGGAATIEADPNDNVGKLRIDFGGDDNVSDTVTVALGTFSENGLRIDISGYDPDDGLVLEGGYDFYVDPNNPGEYTFKYIGADGNEYTGYVNLKDGGEKDFTTNPPPITICFASGSLIETNRGYVLVEDLSVGDIVVAQSGELMPIRWIGRKHVDTAMMVRNPELQPVRIKAGSYGPEQPFVDLVLSPQHRVQISDWRSELLFGEPSVLTAVKHLIDGHRVVQDNVAQVTYFHILLDRHEIVNSNGIASETLHLGDMAELAIGPEAAAEIELLFPALIASQRQRSTRDVVLKRHEGEAIARLIA